MGQSEILTYTLERLIPMLQTRRLSPVEVTRACLERIERLNPILRAYVTVLGETAIEQAREAERAIARCEARGPLHGVPVSVKDVFETRQIETTWGVKALAAHRPVEDSTVVVKLRAAGAILIGKANVDAYPYGEGPASPRVVGPTRNPWDAGRTAGRTSGGSGAAVAARFDFGSIGSDTAGSIRIPAAMCGVFGLMPTFGLVSRYRVLPYSYSFDHCGPLARSAHDCAVLLGAIAGPDPEDPVTMDSPVRDYPREISEPVRGLVVGLPRAVAWEANDPEVTRLVDEATGVLASLGMKLREVDVPPLVNTRWLHVISFLEKLGSSGAAVTPNWSVRNLKAHMRARNAASHERLSEWAAQIRRVTRDSYAEVFRQVDLIATPTIPIVAPKFSENSSPWQHSDEPFAELVARYTRIFNFVHSPAISVPCGFTSAGMPAGLQIAGRPFDDHLVLRTAYAYERATSWHLRDPSSPF